jgi:hypothetical protein
MAWSIHPRKTQLALRERAATHLLQVDAAHQVHLARVDLDDVQARGLAGVGELDLPVDASWPQQRWI